MVDDSQAKTSAHAVLAAVLQVRAGRLQALLWQRAREPFAACWALPGGALTEHETLEESMRRHLADKVDVREVAHLEQLETLSDPARNPTSRELATAFLGLVPSGVDPQVPEDTRWHPLDQLPERAPAHEGILLHAPRPPIDLTRTIPAAVLLDAVSAILVPAVAATVSLLFARGARGAIARTLHPVGGEGCIRLGRILAVAGICVTLSASIAVGLYELLLRLEH